MKRKMENILKLNHKLKINIIICYILYIIYYKMEKKIFIELAKKYRISPSGSKKQISQRLCDLRGIYLSNRERKLILPYLSNNKNKKYY
jgi:hypothetical protein